MRCTIVVMAAAAAACGSSPPPVSPPPPPKPHVVGPAISATSDLACSTDSRPMRVQNTDGTVSITSCSVGTPQLAWSAASAGSAAPVSIGIPSTTVQLAGVLVDATGRDSAAVVVEQLADGHTLLVYRCTGYQWEKIYELGAVTLTAAVDADGHTATLDGELSTRQMPHTMIHYDRGEIASEASQP